MGGAVPAEAKELARNMAFRPSAYRVFGNLQNILPAADRDGHFIEGTVQMGTAVGAGQYRVVCEVNGKGKVVRKYWSASHYGTGADAGEKPAFVEFQ